MAVLPISRVDFPTIDKLTLDKNEHGGSLIPSLSVQQACQGFNIGNPSYKPIRNKVVVNRCQHVVE